MKLTRRELAAVLTGLRVLQATTERDPAKRVCALPAGLWDVLTDCGTLDPLVNVEIDALCDRLNRQEVADA